MDLDLSCIRSNDDFARSVTVTIKSKFLFYVSISMFCTK